MIVSVLNDHDRIKRSFQDQMSEIRSSPSLVALLCIDRPFGERVPRIREAQGLANPRNLPAYSNGTDSPSCADTSGTSLPDGRPWAVPFNGVSGSADPGQLL